MPLLLKLVDARDADITGTARLDVRVTSKDGTQVPATVDHVWPPLFPLNLVPTMRRVDLTITHGDYVPLSLTLRWDDPGPPGAPVAWSDIPTTIAPQPPDQVLKIPLSRVRFAPGQLPPFSTPTGDEKGVYILQEKQKPQRYAGHALNLLSTPPVRRLDDATIWNSSPPTPTCITVPSGDDGWARLITKDLGPVDVGASGAFAWLEYGSQATRPAEPRFLIALWAPMPDKVLKENAVDMLAFYSPSTANDLYPVSTYPFRDKYPYSAYGKEVTDKDSGEKYDAKVQPYVLLGNKYLFNPTYLAPMSAASGKPLVIVMPIAPHASKDSALHQGQPFNSKAGLYRLLLEVRLFLEREGYTLPSFSVSRFNGAIAPTAGEPPPPPPAFTTVNRNATLKIKQIVVAGYSNASIAIDALLRQDAITTGMTRYYPPALFGADPSELDKRWQELWGLDLSLHEATTGIPRVRFETAIKKFLTRDTNRVRLYHGGWTLAGANPDAFLPMLRKLLPTPPRRVEDAAVKIRWATDWRDPGGHWSALFWSGPYLRTKKKESVVPHFPEGEPDGTKGADPPNAIHLFAAQLGFGHASWLRQVP